MKVVGILESRIVAGGGFNQCVNAILQMKNVCRDRFEFEVLTTSSESTAFLEQLGIPSNPVKIGVRDRLLALGAESPVWRAIQTRVRFLAPLERRLLRMGCDLAYFVSPSPLPALLQRLNFIATVWDLCHRDFPEFPEVRDFWEIQTRDRMYDTVLPSAYAVISDSELLSAAISKLYGIDSARIIPMPFSPGLFMHDKRRKSCSVVLQKYELQQGYFFYPAQLWAHKNHARILQAAAILRQEGTEIDMVFVGGDKGEMGNLTEMVNQLGLRAHVRFLGFVPHEEMEALYEGCRAVVMPTYFGPTNLPPLEAWLARRPLIYSRHLAAQVGDAAVLIDPDDPKSLANGMRECFDEDVAKNLVNRGSRRLSAIESERLAVESRLVEALQRFRQRRQCWA